MVGPTNVKQQQQQQQQQYQHQQQRQQQQIQQHQQRWQQQQPRTKTSRGCNDRGGKFRVPKNVQLFQTFELFLSCNCLYSHSDVVCQHLINSIYLISIDYSILFNLF